MSTPQGLTRVRYVTLEGEECEQLMYEENIVLPGKDIVSIDLRSLSLPNLEVLNLSGNPLETIDLSPLSEAVNLRVLKIDYPLEDIDLSFLEFCTKLEDLLIVASQVTSVDLTVLQNLPRLRNVSLVFPKLNKLTISSLSSCPELTSLEFVAGEMRYLNLEFLSGCCSLESLHLSGTKINQMNLTPLSTLDKLLYLSITNTSLTKLSLEPLSLCVALQTINLSSNDLDTLDLLPLSSLEHLNSIFLSSNPFSEINLSPLSDLTRLTRFSIRLEVPITLDFTPLLLNYHLRTIMIESTLDAEATCPVHCLFSPTHQNHSLSEICSSEKIPSLVSSGDWENFRDGYIRLLQQVSSAVRFRFQGEFLRQLGFGQYRTLDFNLIEVLHQCPEIDSTERLQIFLEPFLAQMVTHQVESSGPTHFLDVESLSLDSQTCGIVDRLLGLRSEEIRMVPLHKSEGHLDLRPLWLTEYGYRILESLSLSLFMPTESYPVLDNYLKTAGINVSLVEGKLDDLTEVCSFSPALIDYILWCAEYYSPRTDEHK